MMTAAPANTTDRNHGRVNVPAALDGPSSQPGLQGRRNGLPGLQFPVSILGTLLAAMCALIAIPVAAQQGWTAAGGLATARYGHTASMLPNGKVLAVGGITHGEAYLNSVELYDPATNSWSAAPSIPTPRSSHTATLLRNGKLLVVGGYSLNFLRTPSAQLYDAASNTWSDAASLTAGRAYHTATLLANGKVLVAGGQGNGNPSFMASAELYDPDTDTWSPAGNMSTSRMYHAAALLPNGHVLVVGGFNGDSRLATVETYNPSTNTWSPNDGIPNHSLGLVARALPTATLLMNGKVLVAGGANQFGGVEFTALLYDSGTNSGSGASYMSVPRTKHEATLLPNGKVLVSWGEDNAFGLGQSAELYDPVANSWVGVGSNQGLRTGHQAVLLASGRVLMVGGKGENHAPLASADLSLRYDLLNVNATASGYQIHTIAGGGAAGFSGDGGQAVNAQTSAPTGIIVDAAGNLIVSDLGNNRVRKISPSGVITTIAGGGGSLGDGGPAVNAQITGPVSTLLDAAGNLYVAGFAEARIRKITPAGIISTIAGTGVAGFSGDGGQAVNAQLHSPIGMAFDSSGNLYISDRQNARVRKITMSTGVITTVAGNGSTTSSGDGGPATSAGVNTFGAIAFDASDNLYIADHNHRIRRVTPAGIISTVVGTGVAGATGDGGQAASATINLPYGLKFDAEGNLYIGSWGARLIRMVTPAGIISTVAGNGSATRPANGAPAMSGGVVPDMDIAFDALGNLYFASFTDNHIRKITRSAPPAPTIGTAVVSNGQVTVSFTAAPFNGGAPVTGYIARCGNATGMGTTSPITVSGLTTDVIVTCSVQASNYLGNGSASAASNSVTLATVPGAPVVAQPYAVAGSGQVSVNFTAPLNNGGSPITHFTATCGTVSLSGGASPIVVTGLTNGVEVTCTVVAVNVIGASLPSAPSAAVTPRATQSIAFGASPLLAVGSTGALSATGGASGNPVTFASNTPGVCTLSGTHGGIVSGINAGTCTVTANQAGSTAYSAAPQATLSFAINPHSQVIVFGAAPAVNVGATGSVSATGGASGNPVVFTTLTSAICTISGATVTGVAAGTCTIAANQAGTANYTAAPQVSLSFTIGRIAQTIMFGAAPAVSAGGTGEISATGGASGNPITFNSITYNTCVISGTTVTGKAVGTCTIQAMQAGNADYNAGVAQQSFAISQGSQVITVTPPEVFVGLHANLTASGGASGNPVIFTTTTPAICTISDSVITGVAAGACTIVANQAGNANYAAAPEVTLSVAVSVASFMVTPSSGPNGTIDPAIPQTVNSGATSVFTVTAASGYTASVAGTCGGSLVGTTYTTAPVTANCTVVASFTPVVSGVNARNDFNDDGKSDLLFRQIATNAYVGMLMEGLTVLDGQYLIGGGTPYRIVNTGDLDGDGKVDLIFKNVDDGSHVAWFMNGLVQRDAGYLITAHSGFEVAHVGDLNGDGKADLIWHQPSTGAYVGWLMDGLTILDAQYLIGGGSGYSIVQVADLNGDGKTDLIFRHTDGSHVAWLMNGLVQASADYLIGANTGFDVVNAGDLNGDGKADLIWYQPSTGAYVGWLMNGLTILNADYLIGGGSPWHIVNLSDLNGDGKADLIFKNTADGSYVAWFMNGLTQTSAGYILGANTGFEVLK
jgi:trimeric autotransporter adhesin